jgi:hypothetical protein
MMVRLWRGCSVARRKANLSVAAVGQFDALEIVPDAFSGIELRSVSGQLLEVETFGSSAAQETLDRLATMTGRAIPEDQDLALDYAQEHAQEPDDIPGTGRRPRSGRRAPGPAQTGVLRTYFP